MKNGVITIKLGSEEDLQRWNRPLALYLDSPNKPKSPKTKVVCVDDFNKEEKESGGGIEIIVKSCSRLFGHNDNGPLLFCFDIHFVDLRGGKICSYQGGQEDTAVAKSPDPPQ